MSITRFSPIQDAISLRDAMDRLFQESFIRPAWGANGNGAAGHYAVPVDLWETADAYYVRANLPGVDPNTIEVNVTGDTLTFSGELTPQTDVAQDGWLRRERPYGKFTRSFTLPTQIDANKVHATSNFGVLELMLPKAESVRPKQIKVTAASTQHQQQPQVTNR